MDYDAIVIGAGIAGMHQLYTLRKLGMRVRVFEAAADVGGTWYHNRYPGCRFDSESFTYGYSWSPEILEEWNWTELFASQPETLRYTNFVADKFDLRKDIEFNTRIKSARYDERGNVWTVETDAGTTASARFVITAIGILSTPIIPDFPRRDSFAGQSFHSYYWPEGLDLAGKRVAVIGTGATGVQIIQTIGQKVGSLTVYQRGGNWTKPLRNRPIGQAEMNEIKAEYPEIFERCKKTAAAFVHDWEPRNTFDVSDEEREEFFERRYAEAGFGFWLGGFQDLPINEDACRAAEEFLIKKIRARLDDPKIADILIPNDHPFGAKRVPLETRYYEVYNQDNVELVDLTATPIERISPDGIVSGGDERAFDVIIYATGFDAFRGALDQIDFYGVDGVNMREKWDVGIATYMGLMVNGFPNLLTILGPQNGGSYCNIPRCLEQNVEFITEMLGHMQAKGYNRIEATIEAEQEWSRTAVELASQLVAMKYDSYMNSANTRKSANKKREILVHAGGQNAFRAFCAEIAAEDYRGYHMSQVEERIEA